MARAIDADALREKFSDVFGKTYLDDYAKGFVAGLCAALNMSTLPQPGNEPLTPEQLREMDGKPVWIEHDEDPQYNHVWMIWNNEIGFRHDLAGYNIFWRAYRYPLVGEEDNNG